MNFPSKFPPQEQSTHPGFEYEMTPPPVYDDNLHLQSGTLLQDRVAIITGGDSGIGRSVAIAFAKQGAHVVIPYFNETKDAHLTKEVISSYNRQCLLIETDLREKQNCEKVITMTLEHFKRLDILVNNAAVQYESTNFKELSDDQFDKTFKTNIYGPFYLTKAALPHLKTGASIINTTSVVAYHGNDTLIDYAMTKGALVAFTQSLSMQLAKSKSGIRVNSVAPGPIWTPFIPSAFDGQKVSTFGSDTPIGRAGQPVECAGAYVFLASDAASYITGQTIHINGGEIVNT